MCKLVFFFVPITNLCGIRNVALFSLLQVSQLYIIKSVVDLSFLKSVVIFQVWTEILAFEGCMRVVIQSLKVLS